MNNDYPNTVLECLQPNRKYSPAVLRAVKAFARSKPWRGTVTERQEKFRTLNNALAAAYSVEPPILEFGDPDADSGSSCFIPATNTIRLVGLSVVSFLHEVAHARFGASERTACIWSINLFARIFPKSFARCRHDGHMLRAPRSLP